MTYSNGYISMKGYILLVSSVADSNKRMKICLLRNEFQEGNS